MTDPLPQNLYPSDPLMAAQWAQALRVFITRTDSLALYRKDTGDKFVPALTAMDKIIQESTGRDRAFLIRFIKWFNTNIWGDLNQKAGE